MWKEENQTKHNKIILSMIQRQQRKAINYELQFPILN